MPNPNDDEAKSKLKAQKHRQKIRVDKNGGIYANIRGLYPKSNQSKIPYLENLASISNAPFICITESHLNPNILDAEIQIKNYSLFRSDRTDRSHGGVCTYIRNDLAYSIILKDSNSYCDTLVIRIHKLNLLLITFYRPPKCPTNLFLQSLQAIKQVLNNFEEHNKTAHDIIITTDSNFPDIKWINGAGHLQQDRDHGHLSEDRVQALALLDLADEFFLHQVVTSPTRRKNILDLIFTNNINLINSQTIICNEKLSDHYIIQFNMNYENLNNKNTKKETKNHYKTNLNEYDFHGATEELWFRFNLLMQDVNFEEKFKDLNTTEKLNSFYSEVSRIVDIIFEKKNPEQKEMIFSSKNKIPRKVRILMRNKSNLSKIILKSKSGHKIALFRKRLQSVEEELEKLYTARRDKQENDAIQKIKKNPKFFYSYAKKFSNIKTGIGPFIDENDELITDNFKIAEMLRLQYEKAFSKPLESAQIRNSQTFFEDYNPESSSLPFVHITHLDVLEAIDSLSPNAAHGPDSFPAVLLKKGKHSFCHVLTEIFRSSLETGEVPHVFKMAFISPVLKPGGVRTQPIAYRPVSLTSHLAKTFERVIRKSLVAYLEVNMKMNKNQHGFRRGRSCLSQLLEHYDEILKVLEEGNNADVVYLDFSKCFDKIDIGLLCHKLKQSGISSKLGIWLHNFLTNREQFVISKEAISSSSSVVSGIPQGTVLGPILFLLFISDINNDIESIASMFADDTRVLGNIASEEDVEKMQSDLNKIYKWAEDNNMLFNNSKFEILRYGTNTEIKHSTFYLTANDEIIEEKESLRDLGVIVNNQGTPNDHIDHICGKVKQKSGWILRTFKSRQPHFLKTLWKQLIQPHFDYCSQLMNLNQMNMSKLEKLQSSFTRKIKCPEELNYWERLKHFQMLSQERRMQRYKIIYTWKILEGKVPNCGITPTDNVRKGRLCIIPAMKNCNQRIQTLRDNSFQIVGPRLFNSLPTNIRNKTKCSIDEFKFLLDQFLSKIPDEPKLPGYIPTASNLNTGQPSNCLIDQIRKYSKPVTGGG